MKKICRLLVLCLLILSVFLGCDEPKVEPKDITITLNSGVLELEEKTIETKESTEVTLPSGDTLWGTEKYSFLGWSKTKDGDVSYKAGDKYSSSSDATLYAVWMDNPSITYFPNGGTGGAVIEYHKSGEKAIINGSLFTRDGWGFSSWNTAEDGNGTKYATGQEITLTESLTLYATWTQNKVTLTYDANGGKGSIEVVTVAPGISVTLDSGSSLIRDGYSILSWNTSEDGSGTGYALGSSLTITSDTTLYAVWVKDVTLSYNPNGGSGSIDGAAVTPGTKVTLSDGIGFEYADYTLVSWCTSSDGKGSLYGLGSSVVISSDTTLYAVWKENTKIQYYDGDELTQTDHLNGDKLSIWDGSDLVKDGSEFYGWNTSSDGSGISYETGSTYSGSSDLKLYAQWQKTYDEFVFTLKNDSYSIKASDTTVSGSISIPSTYKGKPVTEIEKEAFQNCTEITAVSIPDSVTSIGARAFRCTAITEMDIPDNVLSIGSSAFGSCQNLKSIKLPDKLTRIEGGTFGNCKSLEAIEIPESVTEIYCAFNMCTNLKYVMIPKSVISVEKDTFFECKNVMIYVDQIKETSRISNINWGCEISYVIWASDFSITEDGVLTTTGDNRTEVFSIDIVIPDKIGGITVTAIADDAFKDTEIESITLPESVTKIGARAFENCVYLDAVTGLENVTSIGENAFHGCTMLEEISLPEGLESINDCTFYGCSSLSAITIPASVTSVGQDAFTDCTNLLTVTINNDSLTSNNSWGVSNSESKYFCGNYKVDKYGLIDLIENVQPSGDIVIPEKVGDRTITKIGTFFRREKITSVTLPSTITSIFPQAFEGCTGLESISIQEGVTQIGMHAFSGCTSLKSITLPESLTRIENVIFRDCTGLESIVIPKNVTEIFPDAFTGCSNLKSIYVNMDENTSMGAPWGATNATVIWKSYFSITAEGVLDLASVTMPSKFTGSVVIPDKVGDITVTALENNGLIGCPFTEVTLPDTLTTIGNMAFQDCKNLISITLPEGVSNLGWGSFFNCEKLESVTLPDGIKAIEKNTFDGCSSLKSITIPDGVTYLGDSVFENCSSLTSIEIPDNVTTVGQRAFRNCSSLMSITIPDTVESIGGGSFAGCSSLIEIKLPSKITNLDGAEYQYYTGEDGVGHDPEGWKIAYAGFFDGCSSLTKITIPDSVRSIGKNTFLGCVSLKSIVIPNKVTFIGETAFAGCTELKTVTLPDSLTEIGSSSFAGCGLTSIVIPKSVEIIGENAFTQCSSLKTITIRKAKGAIDGSPWGADTSITTISWED